MGSRIIKMDPAQGFSAQTGGAAVLLTAAHLGFPLSTTHSITGAVLGAGAAKRLSAVRWGLAGNIFLAWVLTLPCAAAVGALTYGVSTDLRDRRARAAASCRLRCSRSWRSCSASGCSVAPRSTAAVDV